MRFRWPISTRDVAGRRKRTASVQAAPQTDEAGSKSPDFTRIPARRDGCCLVSLVPETALQSSRDPEDPRRSRSLERAGNRPDVHPVGAGAFQTPSKRVHGRAGGDHIVDYRDMTVDRGACPEDARDVRTPRNRVRQRRLRRVSTASPVYRPRDRYARAATQNLCNFKCLVESALAQARRGDRHRGEPVRPGFGGDGADEESRQSRDDTQVPPKLQPPHEVIDRRRVFERTDRPIDWWRPYRARAAQLRAGNRSRSAGETRFAQSRQLAGAGIAEIGNGPSRGVAEQADVAANELHRMPPAGGDPASMVGPVQFVRSSHSSRDVSAAGPRRTGPASPYWSAMAERSSAPRSIPPTFDRAAVRRLFARAGDGEPEFARVMQTAREALLERLDGIRMEPRRILDLGAGTGATARSLARRFRRAEVVSVDPVLKSLCTARTGAPRWFSRHRYVVGEAERLPLSTHSVDLIMSNVALPWFDPVDHALAECLRTLRPSGLMLLSGLGPGTLKELGTSWSGGGDSHRMHPFAEMHVLGDAMVHAGFADVVVDVQRIRLRAPDFWHLCRILSRSGGSGALAARRRGLTAVETFRAAAVRYETLRDSDGSLPVSVELVFGHAWAPEQERQGASTVLPRMDWSPSSRSGS